MNNSAGGQEVRDNPARNRFELAVGDVVAFAAYKPEGDVLVMNHTEVPESLSGQGVGSRLARGALDAVRASGRKIVPVCSFIAGYVEKHPEYRDLVAATPGGR